MTHKKLGINPDRLVCKETVAKAKGKIPEPLVERSPSSSARKPTIAMKSVAAVASIQRTASQLTQELNSATSNPDSLEVIRNLPIAITLLRTLRNEITAILDSLDSKPNGLELIVLHESVIIASAKNAKPKAFAEILSNLETFTSSAISVAQDILTKITPSCPNSLKKRLEKLRQDLRLAQISLGFQAESKSPATKQSLSNARIRELLPELDENYPSPNQKKTQEIRDLFRLSSGLEGAVLRLIQRNEITKEAASNFLSKLCKDYPEFTKQDVTRVLRAVALKQRRTAEESYLIPLAKAIETLADFLDAQGSEGQGEKQ